MGVFLKISRARICNLHFRPLFILHFVGSREDREDREDREGSEGGHGQKVGLLVLSWRRKFRRGEIMLVRG
jgi:hypothetical protein